MATQKESIAKSPSGRAKRTPIGGRNILTVNGKEPGYQYRIVNDTGDRVAQMQDIGYELVDAKDVRVGDSRINQAKPEGTKAQASVGGGIKGYVMRQKQEWYDEDQAAKQDHLNEQEATMKRNLAGNDYGKIEITRK